MAQSRVGRGEMRRITIRFEKGETTGIAFGAEGPPDLIFLHATGFNALTYRSLLEPMSEKYRILAFDQRGHGLSRLPADPARLDSWRLYVRDFLSLMKVIPRGERPPVLAGHSMGGAVALTATAARPSIARGLLLLDPVMPPRASILRSQRKRPLAARIDALPIALGAKRRRADFAAKTDAVNGYRGRGAFATWTGSFLEDYVEDGFIPGPRGVTLACRPEWESTSFASLKHYAAALLTHVRQPVTLIRAAEGSSVRLSDADFKRLKPDIDVETVPRSTHFVPMEQPELVRERLTQMLHRP